jgi:hypothetical protein
VASIRGRSPIRAELLPVGPAESPGLLDHLDDPGRAQQAVGVGHGMEEQAAGAGADQAALLGLVPQAVG